MKKLSLAVLLISSFISGQSMADEYDEDYDNILRAEQAFQYTTGMIDNKIILRINVADGYDLYRRSIKTSEGSEITYIPEGREKDDPYFGRLHVLNGINDIDIEIKDNSLNEIEVRFQGCKPYVICYPEQREIIKINR